MRLIVTLFVLLFTQLFFNLAHAAPQSRVAAEPRKSHVSDARPDERRKKKALKSNKKSRTAATPKTTKVKTVKSTTIKTAKKTTRVKSTHKATSKLLSDDKPLKLTAAHKKRYQRAKQTAMAKLMNQMGKPYRWGGASPRTGFDCSGLIYYAYKDVMKIKMPRTANEMYHLRDAAPIKKSELEKGDLVFFRINNRGAADHVGVYLGDGKFIQSPRTGKDIRISQLDNDYWQNHYVGARRVMTPKNVR